MEKESEENSSMRNDEGVVTTEKDFENEHEFRHAKLVTRTFSFPAGM